MRSQRERALLRFRSATPGPARVRGLRRIGLLALLAAAPAAAQSIPGFTAPHAAAQRALEARFLGVPSAASARETVRRLAARPHVAGGAATRWMADSLALELARLGFDVRIERYDPWLPMPAVVEVAITAPDAVRLQTREPPGGSGAEPGSTVLLDWLAYAGDGVVEAPVVYVNRGLPDDYDALAAASIDVRGRVVLARLGGSFRGVKAAQAERHGAAGLVLFPDPAGDGFVAGDTLPAGPYRPAWSVQRGTLMYMWRHTGDPLTPGRPAIPGVRRLDPADATNLPRIPVVTVGYGAASLILERLDGAVLDGFTGGLEQSYRTGPGPARVRIESRQERVQRPIYNVIATLRGRIDTPVIVGNHFDAWVNGAADPHVGTAVTLEIARGLSELVRSGWRPRRTIVLALWDAEEFGVVGSTEWVEHHREELSANAVAYLNIDTWTAGTLDVTGSPALVDVVRSAARDVKDPISGRSLLEEWGARAGQPAEGPVIGDIGAGSDWTAFLHHAGVPSLQWTMNGRGTYAVYHSSLDTFDYVDRFVDPGLAHAPALASVMGLVALRLAESDVPGFRYTAYAERVAAYLSLRAEQAQGMGLRLAVSETQRALDRFRSAALRADSLADAADALTVADAEVIARALPRVETAFLADEGLPGRPWYRHPLNAPGAATGYDALPLPAVAEAIEARDEAAAANALEVIAGALTRAAVFLEGVTR